MDFALRKMEVVDAQEIIVKVRGRWRRKLPV